MASQSWRHYGGVNLNENYNSGYFNNLVVGNLTLKNQYSGFFNVNGAFSVSAGTTLGSTLSVADNVNLGNSLTVTGVTNLNNTLNVSENVTFQRSAEVYGDLNIHGAFQFYNDIRSSGNLAANGTTLQLGYGKLGTATLVCNINSPQNGYLGVDTPVDRYSILPGSTFDIYNSSQTSRTALNVYNGAMTSCQSVLASAPITIPGSDIGQVSIAQSNLSQPRNGIIAYTDQHSCSINMFTNLQHIQSTITGSSDSSYSYMTVNPIANTDGDLAITYSAQGQVLSITGQLTTHLPSGLIVGAITGQPQTAYYETLSVFTDPSQSLATPLLPLSYDISVNRYRSWNTTTLITPPTSAATGATTTSAATFMNIVTPQNMGARFGGGTYINDISRSIAMIGVTTDQMTHWTPTQMIVSGSNPMYNHSTLGINTFAPQTETYTVDINGPVSIKNGEITLSQTLPFAVTTIVSCPRNRNHSILLGSPLPGSVSINGQTSYQYPIRYTHDGGITWRDSYPFYEISIQSANAAYIYDPSTSLISYRTYIFGSDDGNQNWYSFNINDSRYNTNGAVQSQSIGSFQENCTAVKIFDFPSGAALVCYASTPQLFNYTGRANLSYIYLSSTSNFNKYLGKSSNSPFINSTKFAVDISAITALDGYDASYVFVAGTSGIYKFSVDTSGCDDPVNGRQDGCNIYVGHTRDEYLTNTPIIPGQTIIKTPITSHNIGLANYRAMMTYKSYDPSGRLLPDPYFTVWVGDGILTSSTDGGVTYRDTRVPGVFFNSVYIHDRQQAIATAPKGVIYTTHDAGTTWKSAYPELNQSGIATNLLMNSTCNLTAIAMTSANDLVISRVDVSYNVPTDTPSTNIYFCHAPTLFNRQYSSVLDICGSAQIFGYTYIQNDITVGGNILGKGSLTVNQGSVQIQQGFLDPTGTTAATLVVNGGMAIAGNTVIGNNLTVYNSLSIPFIQSLTPGGNLLLGTNAGNINIGSFLTTQAANNINIGTNADHIVLSGSIVSNGALSTTQNKLELVVDVSLASDINPYCGFTIGGFPAVPNSFNGFMMTDVNNNGFLLKAPGSATSVDLLLSSMTLNPGVNRGIMTVIPFQGSGYVDANTPLDPSFIVSCCPSIDISHIVLTDKINAINNLQTINTDISINGNLTVSNPNGSLQVRQANTSSNSTTTGAVTVLGGVGVSGNLNVGGKTIITGNISSVSTNSGTLQVQGGVGISGNTVIGGITYLQSTVDSTSLYSGGLQVRGGAAVNSNLYVGKNVYIEYDCYIHNGDNNPYPTRLSMTDFSDNVVFHSTNDAFSPTSAAVQVVGGVGIGGNLFTQGNLVVTPLVPTPAVSTATGALQVYGGVGIQGNIYIGGNLVLTSPTPTPAVSTATGELQVPGGVGIGGNIYIGGNTVLTDPTPATNPTTGALQVTGGVSIQGNLYTQGTHIVTNPTAATSTTTGAFQVVGGTSIGGNTYIGGNTVIQNNLQVNSGNDALSCYSGAVQVQGGLGVQGNLFVLNDMYTGNGVDLLSGLIVHYPFDTDISNYASGTPVSDMTIYPAYLISWTTPIITTTQGHMTGYGGALDISNIGTKSNFLGTNSTFSSFSQFQSLTQFAVSFWVSVRHLPPTLDNADLFTFSSRPSTNGNYAPGDDSLLYMRIDGQGTLRVSSSPYASPPSASRINLSPGTGWYLLTLNCITVGNSLNGTLYINGALDSSYVFTLPSSSTLPLRNMASMNIGYDTLPPTTFHYLMDDFRIYNRALSTDEITELYDASGLSTYTTNLKYQETVTMNSDNTTFTTTPTFTTVYQPLSLPPNTAMAVAGNLAVAGATNLRGNTTILGDLNITGTVMVNGSRLGYYLTDSSMVIAGPGGYYGGSTTVGNIYLNTVTLGNGGYYGGNTTTGNIAVNKITVGAGGYYGGSTSVGYILVNTETIGSAMVSTNPTSGALQVTGGTGIGGNINVGGSTSIFSNTTPSTGPTTGTVVITGGEGIGGNINVGGSTSVFSNTTPSTGPTTGTVVITGGEGIGGNVNVGGSTSVFSNTTPSTGPTTGTVVITGGEGIGGNINVGGSTSVFSNTTPSTGPTTGTVVITGGEGIGGNINVGGSTSVFSNTTPSTGPTTGTVVITGGEGIGGNINVGGSTSVFSNTTPSTGPTTGTVVITGGEGIGGNVNVGGSTSIFSNTTPSTGPTTGTVVITGGEGIGGNINVGGSTSIFSNTTPSTGPTTGTVVITGGEGIGGNINVGGSTSIFSGTTASTGSTSGTVVIKGGVGVAGNVNIAGNITGNNGTLSTITVSGTANIGVGTNSGSVSVNTVQASTMSTDTLNVPASDSKVTINKDGIAITGGTLTVGQNASFVINSASSTMKAAVITNTADAYAGTTSGQYNSPNPVPALTVAGGVGVNKNLYVGASLYVVTEIKSGGTITGSSFNATSDYRIKHEIQELDEAFTVDNLRPVKYLNTLNQREDIGFIAHEVQTAYPYLVTGDKDAEPLQTLNYTGLIGVLVNEIHMLKARITVLENQSRSQ